MDHSFWLIVSRTSETFLCQVIKLKVGYLCQYVVTKGIWIISSLFSTIYHLSNCANTRAFTFLFRWSVIAKSADRSNQMNLYRAAELAWLSLVILHIYLHFWWESESVPVAPAVRCEEPIPCLISNCIHLSDGMGRNYRSDFLLI